MKDYYAILGVSPAADHAEIKKAFRKLAVRYHPDKNPSAVAKTRFQEISEAYDVLGDSVKRAAYDERLTAGRYPREPAEQRPKGPPASYLLMRKSLPYVMWISRVSLVYTCLFFLDYVLPYQSVDDYIRQVYAVRRQGQVPSYIIQTGGGEQLQVGAFDETGLGSSREIVLSVTRIFRSVMTVSNKEGSYTEWVGYMYTTHVIFPVILFINALLALLNRKRVEFCFNLNIAAFILLILNLTLL